MKELWNTKIITVIRQDVAKAVSTVKNGITQVFSDKKQKTLFK